MAAACENPTPLTCEELEAIEQDNAQRVFDRFCNNVAISDLIQLFFMPSWATDQEDQRKALVHYLTRHAICRPDNNKGTDCDPEEPCEDPRPTYCPDPEECPSKFYGYGLLELIKSAVRADSMVYLPVRDLDQIAAGEPLVWWPTAAPDNVSCDPCVDPELGAFVPQHIYEQANP